MASLSLLRGIVSPNARGERASGMATGVVCDVGCLRRNVNLVVKLTGAAEFVQARRLLRIAK
jgi:hypothetical protein